MRVVFIGASTLAILTAQTLVARDHEVVIVDKDQSVVDSLSETIDCGFLNGDGTKPAVLREAGVIRCRAEGRKRCYSAVWPEGLRELLGCVEALLATRDGGADSDDLNCNEP